MDVKKGDFLVNDDKIWEVIHVNSGNYLLSLRKPNCGRPTVNTANRNIIKHMLVNQGYKHILKKNSNTIKVLYS